ncbi:hypothetical protein GCM10009133_02130 [Cocleimonas flava]|uniref:Uncharacterized protein n=1 Tax=Cocleimonas flava TaxID=634765 RepID=A0A4R1EU39_9GAMM|nr:hypothetical protein [Cocleimonas flava]TCJ85186.1 hypothetical protein EV695_3153 [Cocleimonas flava]
MKSLNVESHPDKTWLGRAKNSFDFLGFRITPTSIQASNTYVSCRNKKVLWHYEKGANNKPSGQYLRQWLGWSLCGLISVCSTVYAAEPATDCESSVIDDVDLILRLPSGGGAVYGPYMLGDTNFNIPQICESLTAPDLDDTTCLEGTPPFIMTSNIPFYANLVSGDLRCTYQVTITDTATTAVDITATLRSIADPTAVPIFTPLGIVATISGLLWFGRRRSIKLKSLQTR